MTNSLKSALLVATLYGVATLGFLAQAQPASFGLEPTRVELSATPGAVLNIPVRLFTHASNIPIGLVAGKNDFTLTPDHKGIDFKAGTLDRSAAAWLTVNPSDPTIPSQGEVKVTLRVAVPADAKLNGTYWALVDFAPSKVDAAPGGLAIRTHLQMAVYINVGKVNMAAQVGSLKFDAVNHQFTYQLDNKGNALLRPKGTLTLLNSDGQKIATLDVPDFPILPSGKASGAVPLPATLHPAAGAYIAILTFSQEGLKPVAAQATVQL